MTYAKWLEHVQKEKEARAAQDAAETAQSADPELCEAERPDPDCSGVPRKTIPTKTSREPHPGATRPACPRWSTSSRGQTSPSATSRFTPFHHSARCGRPLPASSSSRRRNRYAWAIATDLGYVRPTSSARWSASTCCCWNPTRPGDAEGRPVPVGGEAARAVARRASLQPTPPPSFWPATTTAVPPTSCSVIFRRPTTFPSSPCSQPKRRCGSVGGFWATAFCSPSSLLRLPQSSYNQLLFNTLMIRRERPAGRRALLTVSTESGSICSFPRFALSSQVEWCL